MICSKCDGNGEYVAVTGITVQCDECKGNGYITIEEDYEEVERDGPDFN